MLLLVHVSIALSSLVFTTYSYFAPSKTKLYAASALVSLTLVSGTILVISTHSNLLSACEAGLFYLAVVSTGLVFVSRKLRSE